MADAKGKPIHKGTANLNRSGTIGNAGGFRVSEKIRDVYRLGLEEAAPKVANIMNGRLPYPEFCGPDPDYKDMAKAWEFGAKYALPELESVVEERLISAVATVLARDSRIPFDCIGDITDDLIRELKG